MFLGTDYLTLIPPWKTTSAPEPPTNACVGDTFDAALPQRAEFRNRVWEGDFPLWDPHPNGGAPLGAVPDSGMLSPLNVPYLVAPLWMAPALSKLFELSVAIGFTYLLLRRLSLGRPGAWLAGLVYASTGFMVVWTNWPQTHVAALIPALFWAVERFLQLRTVRSALPISAVAAVMLFEGFPAVTGWAMYALVAYLAVRGVIVHRKRIGRAARDDAAVGAALVLGLGVAAVQVVPFLYRLQLLDLEGRAESLGAAIPRAGLATLAVPDAFGSCGSHGDPGYWGPLNDIETNGFAGVAALVLMLCAMVLPPPGALRRGMRGFFAAAAATTVWLTYVGGWPLKAALNLPVFDINSIGRMRALMGFFIAVLAGIGFEAIRRQRRANPHLGRRRVVAALVACAAAVVLGAVVLLRARSWAADSGHLDDYDRSVALAAALGILAIVAAVAAMRARGALRTGALAFLPILVLAQALVWVWPFWPRVDPDTFYPDTAAHQFLQDEIGTDRFAAEGVTMYPSTGAFYGLRSIVGHSFTDDRWKQALQAIDPSVFITRTFSLLPSDPAVATSSMLDRLAARYFVAAPEAEVLGTEPEPATEAVGTVELHADSPFSAAVPAGPLRALGVALESPAEGVGPNAELVVEIVDESGAVQARGSRFVPDATPAVGFLVPVPGETVEPAATNPSAEYTVRITLVGTTADLRLAADASGDPMLLAQHAPDDGLRMVANDRAVIYERTRALPRIRWASRSRSIANEQARLEFLATTPADRDEVVLSSPGLDGEGRSASVEVQEDSGDIIRVRVDAAGAGYVVVADPPTAGWHAEVDGRPAELVSADHAGTAVFVDAGEHEVVLEYVPDGWHMGLAVTGMCLAFAIALWVWGDEAVRRTRRFRRGTGDHLGR